MPNYKGTDTNSNKAGRIMKKIFLTLSFLLVLLLFYSISSMGMIKADPEILDFGNIFRGKEYSMGFNLVLNNKESISFDDIEIIDILVTNNDIKLIKGSAVHVHERGALAEAYDYRIIYQAEDILGKLEDKLTVIYRADSGGTIVEKKLEIEVRAYISGYYVISPPSVIIRDLVRTQEKEYVIFAETKDKSKFKIIDAVFSSENCRDINIEEINDYRKKITLLLIYPSEGRFFERLILNTDNKTFPIIEIEALANITGFITLSKRDISFGRVGKDDDAEDSFLLNTIEGLELEILDINDGGAGLLTFEINHIRKNTIAVDVFLYPEMLKRDFFGTINIHAKAGEHREYLQVTYHGTLKK